MGESLYGLSNDRFGTLFLEKFKRKQNKTKQNKNSESKLGLDGNVKL